MQFCGKHILPDYASKEVTTIPLQKVGVRNVRMFRKDFTEERVITKQSAYVDLGNVHGIHMSRLMTILFDYENLPIDIEDDILQAFSVSHDDSNSYWECNWDCRFETEEEQPLYVSSTLEGRWINDEPIWYLTLTVPYTSVCPCSAEMVKYAGRGIPHMQRAFARVTGQLSGDEDLDDFQVCVISNIVESVGLIPLPIMKRGDELEWCIRASEDNLFVEDAAREIAKGITPWFQDWVIVCEHEESIHQHNVVAVCRKGDKLT